MKRHLCIFLLLASAVLTSSCNKAELFPLFIEREDIHLQVGGEDVFKYDENSCQLGFNRELKQFRVHTDNMSDYFCITMNDLPESEGDIVVADISWTTMRDVKYRKKITLEAVKLKGDKIWFWNDGQRIAAVVQILD